MKIKIPMPALVGFLFVALFISGCNSYTPKYQDDKGQILTADAGVDFAVIQSKILQPYCVSCHSAAGGNAAGINVENYANVKRYIEQIHGSIAVRQTMPPGNPISSPLQQLLVTWVANGSPEYSSPGSVVTQPQPTAPPTPTPTPAVGSQVTYSALSKNIFVPKCLGCHGANMKTYDGLMKSKWVTPGNMEKSALYKSVKSKDMPPSQPLSQNEIDNIGTWITAGAKNN